jgi:hypothetical protein
MDFLGRTKFTSLENPDSLEFSVVREDGLLEKILAPIITAIVILMFWRAGQVIIAAFATLSSAAYFMANWIHGPETRLRVTNDELIARGNLHRLFKTELRIHAIEISSLRFDSGGERDERGLHAKLDWGSTLVLPGVNEEQAEEICDKIAARFPYFPVGERFGRESRLITLGLSKPAPEDSELRS